MEDVATCIPKRSSVTLKGHSRWAKAEPSIFPPNCNREVKIDIDSFTTAPEIKVMEAFGGWHKKGML